MTTQIMFTIDPSIKIKAQQKAKQQGLTLKAVLVNLLQCYNADQFSMQFVPNKNSFQDLNDWEQLENESREALQNGKRYNDFSELLNDV